MIPANAKERFSDRVDDYVKYRPGYPTQVVDFLKEFCSLNRNSVVADIGSGTGIMTQLLLPHCRELFAVEPNPEMRSSAEKQLHNQQNFVSINGSAEATTLKNQSIDILVAAQAFHWFNPEPTRKEFQRILKPSGWIALIWNKRDSESDAFHRGYETLLKNMIPEYSQVNHHKIDDKARESFFGHKNIVKQSYSNYQEFDWDGLKGRFLSSSYVPKDGQPNHDRIINGLHELFQKYQTRERIRMNYLTEVYAGQLYTAHD